MRRNSSVVSANPEAIRQRMEALDRANKEGDEEKGAEFFEKVKMSVKLPKPPGQGTQNWEEMTTSIGLLPKISRSMIDNKCVR